MGTTDMPQAAEPSGETFFRAVLAAAWMAIVLGLVVQALVFFARAAFGAKLAQAQLVIDVAGGVTWSVIVCSAVAVGAAAAKNAERAMGVLGVIFAPAAFTCVKVLQRGLAHILGQPPEALGPAVYETGLAKMVEYGLLGYALGWLVEKKRSTLASHAGTGLVFGGVFSTLFLVILIVNAPGAEVPGAKLAGTAINELVFPIGCSMVLYWVNHIQIRSAPKG